MPKSVMTYAVELLRRTIGDAEGTGQHFTAEQLELFLDQTRTDVVERDLVGMMSPIAGNMVTLRHVVPNDLAGLVWVNATLTNSAREVVVPDASNDAIGEWTFAADTPETLYITGLGYDINAAGALACDAWATALSRTLFDVSDNGASYHRSQVVKQLRDAANQLRSLARGSAGSVRVVNMVRDDVNY